MGLFDFLKRTPTVRCSQCGVQIKETDAHRYRNGVYCSICFGREDFIKENTPTVTQTNTAEKKKSDDNAAPDVIRDIKKAFEDAGVKYFDARFGDQWEVHAGVNGNDVTYIMKFISKISDQNVLGLRIFGLIHVPAQKRRAALAQIAQLQTQYRFWRFNLDSDGHVNVEYDFPPATSNHGAMAIELFLRTMKMVDEVYPQLSKCVWQ